MNKVYIFSNVNYPESKKVITDETDILVFCNHAKTASYYEQSPALMKFLMTHRKNRLSWCYNIDRYDFPKRFVRRLRENYDKDCYFKKPKKKFLPTSGYTAAYYFKEKFPEKEVVLVNFGYNVKHSTKRPCDHNWLFEAEKLKEFTHIYTCELVSDQKRLLIKVGRKREYYSITKKLISDLQKMGYRINVISRHKKRFSRCNLDRSIRKNNCDFFFREQYKHDSISRIEKVYILAENTIGEKIPRSFENKNTFNENKGE